jgi:uncharacterized protein (TIGR02145 family)
MKTKIKLWLYTLIVGMLIVATSCKKDNDTSTVTDFDGNVYQTVTIGSQVWMKENLKVTHYRNGDSIPNITDNTLWCNLTSGAYCNYGNTNTYVNSYGRLYNWHAVKDSRNICPVGWHIPTYNDWVKLSDYLGDNDAGKMKESGTSHWESPNSGANNSSGFTGLPGGSRGGIIENGSFMNIGEHGVWWSVTESNDYDAYYWYMSYSTVSGYLGNIGIKEHGYSVRCVKD